jgi:hypothetical protein
MRRTAPHNDQLASSSSQRKFQRVNYDVSLLTDTDVHFFNEGTHYGLYEKLGAHPLIPQLRAKYPQHTTKMLPDEAPVIRVTPQRIHSRGRI